VPNFRGAWAARRAVAALALAFAGCDSPFSSSGPEADLEEARRTWRRQGIASYSFKVSQLCFCGPDVRGTLAVVVEQGRVVSVTDEETGAPRTPHPVVPLTVEALFAKVEDAIDRDAHQIEVRYDPRLGYPLEIAIDFIELAIDDEVTYTASDLAPLR
jgi:uncharacterized protein DUF6174